MDLRALQAREAPFLGCLRRWLWTKRVWRSDAGVAVLLHVGGVPETVVWDRHAFEVFYHPDDPQTLLLWRPGPWRDEWAQEIALLCGTVRASGALLLHEIDGATVERYVGSPVDAAQQLEDLTNRWRESLKRDVPLRLDRTSKRAAAICPRCPVRRRCEALDIETGQTSDWLRGEA